MRLVSSAIYSSAAGRMAWRNSLVTDAAVLLGRIVPIFDEFDRNSSGQRCGGAVWF